MYWRTTHGNPRKIPNGVYDLIHHVCDLCPLSQIPSMVRSVVLCSLLLFAALISLPKECDCVRIVDPSCKTDTNETVKDVIVSEGYYKRINKTSVYILAEHVELSSEEYFNFDPCKDLQIDAVNLVIKGTVALKARSVTINTINLTVVDGTAAIDVSYYPIGLPDYHVAAAPGGTAGAAGANGKNGGGGGDAGTIDLTLSRLIGGKLFLGANGGQGGRGQDGGIGHIGANAATPGSRGGKGGDGGVAGKSGNGGKGGVVSIHIPTWASRADIQSNINVSVAGGKPGLQAQPGKPEPGGIGSPTSGSNKCFQRLPGALSGQITQCREKATCDLKEEQYQNPDIVCVLGPCVEILPCSGPPGQSPIPTSPATFGSAGNMNFSVGCITKETPITMIQMALRNANNQYKKSYFEPARDIYMWIMDVTRNSTNKERASYFRLSTTYLSQLAHGFDFWGHLPNNVPLNSYESIVAHLENDVIPYARDVEADYVTFFSKSTDEDRRYAAVQNSVQHTSYLVGVSSRQMTDATAHVAQVVKELSQLEKTQAEAEYRSDAATQACKDAIHDYIESKESGFGFFLKEIFSIVKAGVEIFTSVETGFKDLTQGIHDIIGALDAAKSIDGKFWDDLKKIGTIVKNVTCQIDKVQKSIVTDVDSIKNQFTKIKGIVEQTGHENDAKMVVDGEKFTKMIGKWLFLPECANAKAAFTAYLNVSRAVNDKIMQHDSLVIQVAQLESQISKYEEMRSRLEGQIVEDYDPFTTEYAVAVGDVYVNLKDAIVKEMKKMQEAYNYQFLEATPFMYDDSRIAMIEAWIANSRIKMMDKMERHGAELQEFNKNAKPLMNTIVLTRKDLPDDFSHLDSNGYMPFTLSGAENELAPLTHVHMTDVKVWLPGIKSTSNRVRVWLKRFGSSVIYDSSGKIWTFTHAARTMLFDYDKDDYDVNVGVLLGQGSQNGNSDMLMQKDYVALSPIGPWMLGIPTAYNPDVDTTRVNEIHIQLSGTFEPCADLQCPPRKPSLAKLVTPTEESKSSVHSANTTVTTTITAESDEEARTSGVSIAGIVLGVAGAAALIVVVVACGKQRARQKRRGYDKV